MRAAGLVLAVLLGVVAGLVGGLVAGEVAWSHVHPDVPSFSLSSADKDKAINLMRSDRHVRQLLHGKRYRVSVADDWNNREGQKIGAVITLQFKPGARLSGEWIGVDWDCSERARVPEGRVRYRATRKDVRDMDVFVDLRRNFVAGIEPDQTSRFVGRPVLISKRTSHDRTCEGE